MIKAIILKLIVTLGKWLHSTNGSQFDFVLSLVKAAASISSFSGAERLAWVKTQLAAYLTSDSGKAMFGKLSKNTINWLIETAVSFLRKA